MSGSPKAIKFLGGGFKYFVCSPPFGEDFPFWLIFFKGVETTNQIQLFLTARVTHLNLPNAFFLPEVLLMVHSEALWYVKSPISFTSTSAIFCMNCPIDSITCYSLEVSCSNMFFTGSYESTWIYQSNITSSSSWFTKTSVTYLGSISRGFSVGWSLYHTLLFPNLNWKKTFLPVTGADETKVYRAADEPGTSGRWAAGPRLGEV